MDQVSRHERNRISWKSRLCLKIFNTIFCEVSFSNDLTVRWYLMVSFHWNPITPFCFCTLQRTSQLHWGEANIPNLPLNIGTSSSNLSNSGKHKLSFLHSWIRREATRCLSWISCLWIQMEERTSASGRTQYNTQTWGQPAVGPCLIPSPPNCVTFVN